MANSKRCHSPGITCNVCEVDALICVKPKHVIRNAVVCHELAAVVVDAEEVKGTWTKSSYFLICDHVLQVSYTPAIVFKSGIKRQFGVGGQIEEIGPLDRIQTRPRDT